MSKKCPHCRLLNPHTSVRCDCGYDFGSGVLKESFLQAHEAQKAASEVQKLIETHGGVGAAFRAVGIRNMIHGATWCIGSLLLTAAIDWLAAEQVSRSGRRIYGFALAALVFVAADRDWRNKLERHSRSKCQLQPQLHLPRN